MLASQYYFKRLTEGQKDIYKTLLAGIESFAREIHLPTRPIHEHAHVLNGLLLDNPLIFYVAPSFSQSCDARSSKCVVTPNYTHSKLFARQGVDAIHACMKNFDAVKGKSDLEKELAVHDFCLNHFRYDYSGGGHAHSILGPVLNKVAVCEGIAKFVKGAMDYLGVRSLVVCGKAENPVNHQQEAHAWNIVVLDGEPYHLDVTFDMTLTTKAKRYDYFNLADADIQKDHEITGEAPACVATGRDYFAIHSRVAHNPAELGKFIENALKNGGKSLMVKLKNVTNKDGVLEKVMSIAQRQFIAVNKRGASVEVGYNPSQMVFEIRFM